MTARAIDSGAIEVVPIDVREWGLGVHRQVDDAPFGGGPGMVMRPEPLAEALDSVAGSLRVLLSPTGDALSQDHLDRC